MSPFVSAVVPSSSNHSITLPDGSIHNYHLRSLTLGSRDATADSITDNGSHDDDDDDDISRWTKFCASVFSYKPNPPPASYFARHFYNDPRHDASLVRVLVYIPQQQLASSERESDGEIVSSVRIFRRTLSTGRGSAHVEAGGIGEVCTLPSHQRRGLSKLLLHDALDIMRQYSASGKMACSSLHASPAFRPVYRKGGGYECVRSEWSLASIDLAHLSVETTGSDMSPNYGAMSSRWAVRNADFRRDVPTLMALHKEYSENRFAGCIIRSEQYWKEYVSAELGDTLWVLTTKPKEEEEQDTIVAWISLRKRGDRFQLREFGVDKRQGQEVHTSWAMGRLLGIALHQAGAEGVGDSSALHVPLLLPTEILSEIQQENKNGASDASYVNLNDITVEDDDGWMYVVFDNNKPNIFELTQRKDGRVPHLVWPTDSF